MMNDLNFLQTALSQHASGQIIYGNPVEAEFASGSITYGVPVGAEYASIAIQVTDFAQLVGTTLTVDGTVLTEGVEFTAAVDNNTTGASIASAIDALGNWTAAGTGTVTAKWSVRGTIGNGKTVTSNALGGIDIAGTGLSGVTASGVNGDEITVGGTKFTCVVGTAGANEFSSIVELEALVEAVANLNSSENGTVISITYATRGTTGNSIGLVLGVSNAGTMSVSAATLTGGLNGDTITVDGQLFTAVASAPGANEFSNITELEVLIEALAGINSSVSSGIITVQANEPGVAGNAITLALGVSNAGTMAISGATLSGGVASTVTDDLQLDAGAEVVKLFLEVANLTSGATLTVTPQTSIDNDDWQDLPAIIISANGDYREEISDLLTFFRVKFVLDEGSAVSPSVDLTMQAQPGEADTEREHDFAIPSALATSGVVKAAPGKFYGISGYIDETAPTADVFLYVYDALTVPANGALDATKLLMPPLKINQVNGLDTEFSFDYDGKFKRASTGIVWFLSTTGGLTKTLAGAYAMPTIETE